MSIKKILESERGSSNHGWLKAKFSFSFANWYHPEKMGFGALRVLNNDKIAPAGGFPTHSHSDMEIVTIPLKGAVAHKDSTGTDGIIKAGEVQIMSAGTGILHSEYNASETEELELFQIWVIPDTMNLKPRYDQRSFEEAERVNKWQIVVAPNPEKFTKQKQKPLKIYQEAYFSLTSLDATKTLEYKFNDSQNGAYLMVVEGEVETEGENFRKRDAAEITNLENFEIKAKQDSKVLVVEVKML